MRINRLTRILPWIFLLYTLHITLYTSEALCASKGNPPVAYWRFDEGGGGTGYDSAGSNNGALNAGAGGTNTAVGQMWTRQGKIGGALNLDGTDDGVSIGSSALTTGATTISLWLKPTSSLTRSFGDLQIGGGSLIMYQYSTDKLMFGFRGNPEITTPDSSLPSGTWSHVVFVYNNGAKTATASYKIYINGIEQTLSNSGGSIGGSGTSNNYVGRENNVYSLTYFSGLIDDVKIYNYARAADQILVDYNAGMATHSGAGIDPNEGNPPVLYYKFDENAGTTVYDKSGNNNNAPFSGSPAWAAGKYGTCIKFPSDNDYIAVPANSTINFGTSNFSVVSWVNIPKPANYGSGIFGKYSHNTSLNGCFVVGIGDDMTSLFFHHRNMSGSLESYNFNYSLYFSQWVHMAWVKSGTKLYLYLNGQLMQSWTLGISFDVTFANGGNYMISNTGWSPGDMLGLMVDDHKLYNYARTPAQIAYDYNKGKPVAQYKFDEGGGAISHNEYSTADTGAVPVGWWRMDNNWNDASGNGYTGTATGNAAFSSSSKIGPYCGAFDGSGDCVGLPSFSSYIANKNQLTYEAWFKTTGLTGTYQEIIEYGVSDFAMELYSNSYDLKCIINNVYKLSYTVTPNTWYHAAIVLDVPNVKLYVNGVLVSSATDAVAATTTTSSMAVGGRSGGSLSFNGFIDDARIYNYARTAEQIYNDYKTTHGTLVGDTKFVDGKIGKALQFDGSGDYMDAVSSGIPYTSGASTVSFWMYSSTVATQGIAVNCGSTANGQRVLNCHLSNIASGKMSAGVVSSAGWQHYESNTLSNDTWYHFTLVNDIDNLKFYFYQNGVLLNSGGTTYTGTFAQPDLLRLGNYVLGGSYWFNGRIDDVRIYNYARTADQVMQDYNAGATTRLGAQSAGTADPWGGALPVAYWKLDENTGVLANDASGNGNNGTLTNGPAWTQGKVGSCLSFNGSNSYVSASVPQLSGVTQFTLEAWINFNSLGSSYPAIFTRNGTWDGSLFIAQSGSKAGTQTGGGWTPSTTTLSAGTWYHVASTYNGSAVNLYVNGVKEGSYAYSSALSATNPVNIGTLTSGNSPFNGKIDDVKVYNYARTQAQVAWDYNKGKPAGYWRFDESSGATCYDDSGNGNSGTATIGATGTQTTIAAARTNGATGKYGHCMSFDGTDDYVNCGTGTVFNFQEGNFWTVSLWMKTSAAYTGTQGGKKLLSKATGGALSGYAVAIGQINSQGYDNKIGFTIDGAPGNNYVKSFTGMPVANDGNWHHVVIVFDASTNVKVGASIYFDGVSYGYLDSTVDKAGWASNAAQSLKIGSGNGTEYFTGQIDDARIYNYARTADQILQDYNQGLASKLGE